jgi:hypothetical protein
MPPDSDFVHRIISKEGFEINGLSLAQVSRSYSFPLACGYVHIYFDT